MFRVAALALAALVLTGCDSGPPVADAPVSGASTAGTTSGGGSATSSAPPPETGAPGSGGPEGVAVDGPCPYLETDFVEQTVGQMIERSTYTTVNPDLPPDCAFYRPDGDPAATVELTRYAGPAEAQTAAIELGTADADPVDDVGDGGLVLVGEDDAVLAVSVEATLLVIRINQASSLEARALAAVVADQLIG